MANTLNSIIKSAICFFSCLNISIFHLASAALLLSLNVILISHMNLSQSWVSVFLSSLSSFFYIYMLAMPPLRQANIVVILLSVSITLLFLRNNLISFHQSSNFVLFPSNHPRSRTILLGTLTCTLFLFTSAVDILSIYFVLTCQASSVIFKDPSHSDNISISSSQCWSVLLSVGYTTSIISYNG